VGARDELVDRGADDDVARRADGRLLHGPRRALRVLASAAATRSASFASSPPPWPVVPRYVTINLPPGLTPEQVRRLMRVAETCPVRRSIEADVVFDEHLPRERDAA
jgi:hypothetical protein